MKRVSIISVLTLLLAFHCKKKTYPEPAPLSGEAPFYAEFLLDNKPVKLSASDNDYYLYTACNTGNFGIYEMTGELKQIACNTCNNSLRIQINDERIYTPGQSIDIDKALKTGPYDFINGSDEGMLTVQFIGDFTKTGSSVQWEFGDGSSSNELNPQHLYKRGIYKVKFTGLSAENCFSSIENTINLESPTSLNAFIKVNQFDTLKLFKAIIFGGKEPYKYAWEFGDGSISADPMVAKKYLLKGSYAVKLTITDAEGNNTVVNYNAISSYDASFCAANFSLNEITPFDNRYLLSKIKIDVVDENGIHYTSDHSAQPNTSIFEILAVEDFINNRNNEKVKRIKVRFDCLLYNQSKNIHLQSKEVFFAVAYK